MNIYVFSHNGKLSVVGTPSKLGLILELTTVLPKFENWLTKSNRFLY